MASSLMEYKQIGTRFYANEFLTLNVFYLAFYREIDL